MTTEDERSRCKTKPLYDKRGNNPPKLIGYYCEEHDEIFTVAMNLSQSSKYVETNHGFQGRMMKNKRHKLRMKAAKKRKKDKNAPSE